MRHVKPLESEVHQAPNPHQQRYLRTTTPAYPASYSVTDGSQLRKVYSSLLSHQDIMAEGEVQNLNRQLHQTLASKSLSSAPSLLSKAKVALLHLNALIPTPKTPQNHLRLARETLELGALISIRQQDQPSFTRYFQQLAPFYALPPSALSKDGGNESKITGLYLLLLLSMGDYAGFHTLLESLEAKAEEEGRRLEDDEFVQYPIRVERALMEGSYDRVWGETKNSQLPSEEFAVFSEVCSPVAGRSAGD